MGAGKLRHREQAGRREHVGKARADVNGDEEPKESSLPSVCHTAAGTSGLSSVFIHPTGTDSYSSQLGRGAVSLRSVKDISGAFLKAARRALRIPGHGGTAPPARPES
ncbi:hypothetical protein SKAU_G00051640 [Synaphobranchus kaupii]|uniref:Uncharacterized protein n=1 Tax=Synaphobranchus kaupii TaxID=118154 RepID=A0A9Q1G354_SYNKA|nr:hypothetical protein SKAU_G00051640 [Synaphobranchus kaupii]